MFVLHTTNHYSSSTRYYINSLVVSLEPVLGEVDTEGRFPIHVPIEV